MSYNPNEGTVTLVKVLVALLIKPHEPYSSIRDQDGAKAELRGSELCD